ncbi:PA2169 family four-helix-bundle protein [Marinomonas aquiplantarum]|uniref:Uncharacterized protein (TIGR02284 family) n=1 Tax=Marinomonas aquiplantarum TaxID=491951 RepID=A0A366D7W5_9GAMM|nr:PA2169 family four-helix-bundle protein [Marinomonas aquiplantarum]RBO86123.1 uncharacterized protein (TIGR02284 family) [Marinomonas aquiplantarum]
MQTQTTQSKHIADIIQVMQGGIEFYQEAKDKLQGARYQAFFNRMIDAKREAVDDLQPFAIAEQGYAELDTDNLVKARQTYTKLMAKLSDNKAFTYVDQLEEVEDKVLDEVDTALEKPQPQSCEVTLQRVKVRMKECHDEMKALQTAEQH